MRPRIGLGWRVFLLPGLLKKWHPGLNYQRMKRPFLPLRLSVHQPGADWLTFLTALLVITHLVTEALGGPETIDATGFYSLFGLSRPGILGGQVWQLLTYSFLHGSLLHLIINVVVIYAIGGRVTRILGSWRTGGIYIGGVVGGGFLHILLFPANPLGTSMISSYLPLVGASGGMMALLIMLVSLSPDSRMWPLMISGKNLGRGVMLSALILFLFTPGLGFPGLSKVGNWVARDEALGASLFLISHPCHIGGGLVGLLFARRLLGEPVSLEELRRDRKKREERNHSRS